MYDIFYVGHKHSFVDNIKKDYPSTKFIFTEKKEIDEEILGLIIDQCLTSWFYILTNTGVKYNIPNIKIPNEDTQYIHTFNNDDNIKLYNKAQVKKDKELYTDKYITSGLGKFKDIGLTISSNIELDIIFLSYDEKYADNNYNVIKHKFPNIKRVHGVKGIFEAHKVAAQTSQTDLFYVVDADAVLTDNFNFNFVPSKFDKLYTHIWRSKNPINNLIYGYGGVKLFPTQILRNSTSWQTDFTMSVSYGLKIIDQVSNITKFNTDPFNAWRSAFRETAKLTISKNRNLEVWLNVINENEPYSKYCKLGAQAGHRFALEISNISPYINDFEWLKNEFNIQCNIK